METLTAAVTTIGVAGICIEVITDKLKDLGLVGYAGWLSLIVALIIALAANIQILPVTYIHNELLNNIVSGFVLAGGSNSVHSIQHKLAK